MADTQAGVEPDSRETGRNLVKEFIARRVDGSMNAAAAVEHLIDQRIAHIDGLLADRMAGQKELLDLRQRLQGLRGSLQGNDKLAELLLDAVGKIEPNQLKNEI